MAEPEKIGLFPHAIMSFIFGLLLYAGYFTSNSQLLLLQALFLIPILLGSLIAGFYVLTKFKQADILTRIVASIGFLLGLFYIFQIFF